MEFISLSDALIKLIPIYYPESDLSDTAGLGHQISVKIVILLVRRNRSFRNVRSSAVCGDRVCCLTI